MQNKLPFSKEVAESIDLIINTTPEELKQEFEPQSLGVLTNFIQKFTLIYELQVQMKNKILEEIKVGKITPEASEKSLNDLYLYMQKIEDTVTVLKTIKDAKMQQVSKVKKNTKKKKRKNKNK